MVETVAVFSPRPLKIRKIELDQPWSWLARGWQDFRASPSVGLAYGILAVVSGYLLTIGFISFGMLYLVLPAAAGFLLLGPVLAVGLYEVSRRREQGASTSLTEALLAFRRNPIQIALVGVALLLLWFFWVRAAALLFLLYFGFEPPSVENLIADTFLSPRGLPFLIIGTVVGAVFAFVAFAISAISIPLLLDQEEASVMEAIAASVRAVQINLAPMILWAVLIVVFIGFGIATLYLGLIVTLPVVGHATWHAYRDLVIVDGSAAGGS